MDWLGIGILLIGIAFSVLVFILIKPVGKLSDTLDEVKLATNRLPKAIDNLSMQATEVMNTSNITIQNVNNQVKKMTPFFHVIGVAGEATHQLTLAALKKTNRLNTRTTTATGFTKREKYEGIYGIISFIFFLTQRSKELKKGTDFIQ